MRCMPEAAPDVRREQVAALRQHAKSICRRRGTLLKDAGALVEKSIWLIGGVVGHTTSALWRFRPCVKPDGECQYSGSGYAVLLQYWRPGIEGDAAWRRH